MFSDKKILFFDGYCHLCNGAVNTILKMDKKGKILYAPLQGETAKELLPPQLREKVDSLIYWRDGVIYDRSAAALWVAFDSAWYLKWAIIALVVPRFIRDAVYNFAARNRYKWFGKLDACRLPVGDEKLRFLP